MGNFSENGDETWRSLARHLLIICARTKESVFRLSVRALVHAEEFNFSRSSWRIRRVLPPLLHLHFLSLPQEASLFLCDTCGRCPIDRVLSLQRLKSPGYAALRRKRRKINHFSAEVAHSFLTAYFLQIRNLYYRVLVKVCSIAHNGTQTRRFNRAYITHFRNSHLLHILVSCIYFWGTCCPFLRGRRPPKIEAGDIPWIVCTI